MARELHDSVAQTLYSVDLFANASQEALEKDKMGTVARNIQQVRTLSGSALADMRLLIFELQPSVLDESGFEGALRSRLESVERRSGLKTKFDVRGEGVLERTVEAELYAIAMEALNNCLKHAQADQVTVSLRFDANYCDLTVSDDGIGFDPETANNTGGFGMKNMRERATKLGGDLTLESSPGKGTTIRMEVIK